jgi:copper(I)-binding protein
VLQLVADAHAMPADVHIIGQLAVSKPWSRATPPGAPIGAGYLTITNNGTEPDTLTGGSTAVAAGVEVHSMTMANGVMSMRAVPEGLTIAPGESVEL